MECGTRELGLESSDFFDIFEMPVPYCVSSLEESSFSTAWSIEEYSVE